MTIVADRKRLVVLPCLFLVFVGSFTFLSLWNSHKAISQANHHYRQHHHVSDEHNIRPSDAASWSRQDADEIIYQIQKKSSHAMDRRIANLPQPVCLTEDCLQAVAQKIARSYPERPKDSWCIHAESRGENSIHPNGKWQGLLLVKVPKAASSTNAGLALRIGNRTKCAVQWEHREGHNYVNRTQQSLLFGSVRRAASRNLSSLWFFVFTPQDMRNPSDNDVIRSFHTRRGGKTKGKGGFQYVYLSLEPIEPRSVWTPHHPTHVVNPQRLHDKIRSLLQSYDFMIVVERMDESLTALALLTGLSLADVLVTNSKVAGSYLLKRVGRSEGVCVRQLKGPLSEGVKNYIESDEWLAMNYADEILFRAANASLDRTIEHVIGRERFQHSLQEFLRLKEKVLQACGSRLGFGCSDTGEPLEEEQCYFLDFGCGYSCVDSVVNQHVLPGVAEA